MVDEGKGQRPLETRGAGVSAAPASVLKTRPPNRYSGLVEACLEAVRGDCFNAESTAVRRKIRDCLKDLGALKLEQ